MRVYNTIRVYALNQPSCSQNEDSQPFGDAASRLGGTIRGRTAQSSGCVVQVRKSSQDAGTSALVTRHKSWHQAGDNQDWSHCIRHLVGLGLLREVEEVLGAAEHIADNAIVWTWHCEELHKRWHEYFMAVLIERLPVHPMHLLPAIA